MKKLIASVFILSAAFAFAESVTGVTAKQRWPWNNLVDIDFTLTGAGAERETYQIGITAQSVKGTKVYTAKSFSCEPIVTPGTRRVTWDFGQDYPNVKVADMVFTVSATPIDESSTPVYLVVDLSGGASAKSYPVRYTTSAPVCTPGRNDPCKTTEMWFKYVRAGTFTAGYGNGSSNNYYPEHTCVLTNDYYMGVFSLTKAQYDNIGCSYSSMRMWFTNATCSATRPIDTANWSSAYSEEKRTDPPQAGTPVGWLRSRTGLKFDLPTRWQWEYVARAGGAAYDTQNIRNATNVSTTGVDRNSTEEVGTSYVDRYPANAWGFYGMLGNVWEFCKDWSVSVTKGATLVGPGETDATANRQGRLMGGAWSSAGTATVPYRYATSGDSWNPPYEHNYGYGIRYILPIKNR